MIDTEIHGFDEAIIRVQAINESLKIEILDAIKDAGDTALKEMQANVPRSGSVGDEGTIADSLRATEPVYSPGGLGGGGFWEMEVGPGPDAPPHLRYVLEGTGLYGPVGNIITSHTRGPMTIFTEDKGLLFRPRSKGQKEQREWLESAHFVAEEVINLHVQHIDDHL